jgi:hypothetical protein
VIKYDSLYDCYLAPETFKFLLSIATPHMKGERENKDATQIFGANKKEWQKVILDFVPPDQIRYQFGGTRIEDESF